MKKRNLIAMALVAAMSMTMFGCGSAPAEEKADAPAAEAATEEKAEAAAPAELKDWEKDYADSYDLSGDEEVTVGFIAQNFADEFSSRVQREMEAYFKANYPNAKLSVGDGKGEVNTHIELAENFITQGVDCLVCCSADSNGEIVICEQAQEAGIPFVVVNSDIACDPADHPFVGSDHYVSGHLQGEYVAKAIEAGDIDNSETLKICYLGGTDGFTHTTLRRQGFYEAMDEAGVDYEVLADLEGEYLRDRGMDITEDWITQYGEEIDMIVAANDEMAMGALQALQAAGQTNTICCGIDANDDAIAAVESGAFGCTVFQDAEGQGKWGAILAYNGAIGKEIDNVSIPYILVDKDNVAEYK
ncbi:MAG: substrate-binding domain-containing protein [Lachnospiraceae bacterium]|nr:substrate-binding domain-containing protein [Lachnospiraceae bacterium]